jgi:recombinational DNA repair protein (RecF pathway)
VSYHLLREGLDALEASQPDEAPAVALGALWSLVSTLGFEPALDVCVRDGRPIPAGDPLDFSAIDGGALCPECGRNGATRLVPEDRADLAALVHASVPRPVLDPAHAAAHRRLLARYIHHHLAEGANLPALEFWTNRPWMKR